MNSSLILVPFLVFAIGVFGDTDGRFSVSVTEGDSVTLHTGVSEIQSNEAIEWRFAGNRVARISSGKSSIEEAFVNRLQLDSQTGDLTFTNISTKDSGEYTLKIRRSSMSSDVTFDVRAFSSLLLPFYHRPNFPSKQETYTRYFSDPLLQIGSPRITPSPSDTAIEHQASSQPPLCSTSHTLSTTARLNLTSMGKTFNFSGILVSFGRANNSSDQKVDSI